MRTFSLLFPLEAQSKETIPSTLENIVWSYSGDLMTKRAVKFQSSYFQLDLIGDMNADGLVNILDIVQLVNLVLINEYEDVSDLNEDGIINVLDIVQIVNIILN